MASDSEKYTIKSPEDPIPPPPEGYKSVPEYLLPAAKKFGEQGKSYWQIDAITKETRYFDKFELETRKIASALYKRGLRKGGTVIYMPAEMIKLHIFKTGVWRANAVCQASYPEDDPKTLEYRIKESECKHILCDPEKVPSCTEAIKSVGWPVEIITTEKTSGYFSVDDMLEKDDGEECPALEVTGSDPALLLCTSGTTGPPKSALYTHSTVVNHLQVLSIYPFTEPKPNVMFSKSSHYSGSLFSFGLLASGKTAIVSGKVSKEALLNTIVEMKPGLVFAFPTYLLTLSSPEASECDLSSVECFFTAGAIVTPVMKQTFLQVQNVKDVLVAYGLTEVGCTLTNITPRKERGAPSYRDMPDFAVGRPGPGIEFQIRDTETLEPLGPYQRGEICSKSDYCFQSYYKNPEATKNAFVDKYFRSGDIGYYDDEGFIFVVDRLKEIFKYYSDHISPSELENVIGEHPLVDEVCVVGLEDPAGHVPRAFVTLKGTHPPEVAEEIKKYANSKLASYKHLRGGLYIIPELPKGKTGKITRNLVEKIKVSA